MRGSVFGLVPVVDSSGPELDVGELVTWLNDAVLLAPSMLLRPGVEWAAVDDRSFGVTVTDHGVAATARVVVDADGRPQAFETFDRYVDLLSESRRSTARPLVSAMRTMISALSGRVVAGSCSGRLCFPSHPTSRPQCSIVCRG